ncbi:MAG: cyclic nucleotide-binding domain-containing protein [Thermoanaerobaculia bacterium]|nr:cyclic nucleotide-binding domain-containing protein [Thermoanaerobaculia bacterium]
MLGKLLGKKNKDGEDEISIEDLITLERFDEAAQKLKDRVKRVPNDLHSHLKLAEVFVELKEASKALDEYVYVADSQADDGFFDKAIAIISKAAKIAPGDDTVPRRLEKYRRMKSLESRRRLAIEGLLSNQTTQVSSAANAALEMELLWNQIAKSHLVEALSAEHLKRLFSVMALKKFSEGEDLAKEGEREPKVMYLIVNGTVEAQAEASGQHVSLRSFTTGSLIGESALLEKKPWPANYVVTDRCTAFILDRNGFERTMVGHEDPRAYIAVLREQHNDREVAHSLLRLRGGG